MHSLWCSLRNCDNFIFSYCTDLLIYIFSRLSRCGILLLTFYYPAPGRGIVFGRFLSLFHCQQHYEKTDGPICMKFSGKDVWSDHGTTWLNFGSIRVNGSAGQRSICLLSPAIAQRTGVKKSVSFARWQQGGVCCASHHSLLFSYLFIFMSTK